MRRRFPLPAACLLLALSVLLGGCYLPVRWDAEITVSRYGTYEMIFDGYVANLPLYDGLQKGEIKPAEEREKVEVVRRDMTRDSATKDFSYLGKGLFRMHWEKSGDLTQTAMVTFFRRNQAFLTVKYVRTTGLVTIEGISLSDADIERITAMGLGTDGQLRIRTDARVVESNAPRRSEDIHRFYIWDVKSLQADPPKLVLSLR